MSNYKIEAGLEIILPGMYYDTMRKYQKYIVEDSVQAVGFTGLKNEYQKTSEFRIADASQIPKIGYSLQAF